MTDPDDAPARLTLLAHGGGCGCKIAPGLLAEILAKSGLGTAVPPALLVGIETSDDAAVYRLNDSQAVVATTDFFTPIVDDPYDFGRIAACNAISDIYAMGANPIFALAVLGVPIKSLPSEVIGRIVEGGESICRAAAIPIAGGHSIDTLEPIYGLVAIGLVDPKNLKRNCTAQDGDVVILGKRLGIGIFSAALKNQALDAKSYAQMVASATQLNTPGPALAALAGVNAMTDVTGFGLLGHLLEVCRGSQLAATITRESLPLFENTLALAKDGAITGASARNWAAYGEDVTLAADTPEIWRSVLTDPQTSGGLLVTCRAESVTAVLDAFRTHGFAFASPIGSMHAGRARISVL